MPEGGQFTEQGAGTDLVASFAKAANRVLETAYYTPNLSGVGVLATCYVAWNGGIARDGYTQVKGIVNDIAPNSVYDPSIKSRCADAGYDPSNPTELNACKQNFEELVNWIYGVSYSTRMIMRQTLLSKSITDFYINNSPNTIVAQKANMDLGMANMSSGLVAVQWIPIIRTVLFLIFFAVLPYLILFMPTPVGWKIVGAITGMTFIFSLWTVTDAFLYRLIMTYSYQAMEDIRNYNLGTFSLMHFTTASLKTLSLLEKSRWVGFMFSVAIGGLIIPLGSSALAMFAGSITSGGDAVGQQAAGTMKETGVSDMLQKQSIQPQKTYEGVDLAGDAGNYAHTMSQGGAMSDLFMAKGSLKSAERFGGLEGLSSSAANRNVRYGSSNITIDHGLSKTENLDVGNNMQSISSEASGVITNQSDASYWQGRFSEMDRRNGTHFADEIGVGKSLSVTEDGNGAIVSASVASGAQSQEYGTFTDADGNRWTGTRMTTGDTTTFKGTRDDGFVGTATQDKNGVHLSDVAEGYTSKGGVRTAQLASGEKVRFTGGDTTSRNNVTSIKGGTVTMPNGEEYAVASATIGQNGELVDFAGKSDSKLDSTNYMDTKGLESIRDELAASNSDGRFDNAVAGLNQRIEKGQGGIASVKRSADGTIQDVAIGGSSLVSQQSDTNTLAEKGTVLPQSTALQQATTGNADNFRALADASDKGDISEIKAQENQLADFYAKQLDSFKKGVGQDISSIEGGVRAEAQAGFKAFGMGGGVAGSASMTNRTASSSDYSTNRQEYYDTVDTARKEAESNGLQGRSKAEYINNQVTDKFSKDMEEFKENKSFGGGVVTDKVKGATDSLMKEVDKASNLKLRGVGEP